MESLTVTVEDAEEAEDEEPEMWKGLESWVLLASSSRVIVQP